MSVAITITNAGLAELVAASHAGSAAITITQIGITASVVAADPTLTALPAEIKRINTFSGMVVAADVIHIGMEDNSPDAYSMYSFGLYLADGTLFALYGQASPIYTKTAASIGLLAVDITFTAGVASAITFGAAGFLNPPASTTVMGVVQLATQAEANAGTNAAHALTPATAAGAFPPLADFTFATDGAGNWKETRPNGVIEMGGIHSGALTSETIIAFTLPFGGFPTAALDFSASLVNSTPSGSGDTQAQEVSITTTTAEVYIQSTSSSGFADGAGGFRWRARGY